MKREHMSIWGVGPIYVFICLVITSFTILIARNMYPKFSIKFSSSFYLYFIGGFLIIFGFIVWFSAVFLTKIDTEIKKDKLVTKGIYAYVRNPIYSGITFLLTGVLICQHSYITLIPPIFFYIFLRLIVKKEERILIEYFGEEYLEYKNKTNAVFLWKRSKKQNIDVN